MPRRDAYFAFLRTSATRWDLVAFVIVIGVIAFLGEVSRGLFGPLEQLTEAPISLDPAVLPEYAARTTLRMLLALGFSLLFTFTYATWAAKSARAARLLVPLLDILQSVPIYGFISVTIVFFMSLAPGRVLGAEYVAIFAIFTSQAWNMAFSFYQSLRTVPVELTEAARSFRLSAWMRFWRLEVPFAWPALVWNMMMSMSGGWFFVVAAESVTVGHTTVALPGIGSYIALAIERRDLEAIGWAIGAMLIVILLYDQLLFRPLVAWADRFRFEQEPGERAPTSWVQTMLRRSRIARLFVVAFRSVLWNTRTRIAAPVQALPVALPGTPRRRDQLGTAVLWITVLVILVPLVRTLALQTTQQELVDVLGLALLTMLRVVVLIALASVFWVPIGVWVGMRPRMVRIVQPIAQFLAAFPANLLFPVFVVVIVRWRLNPDVWLSPLMILGTQWYILFNVIAGASAIPAEMRYAAQNFGLQGTLWWRKVALPAVFPFYLTGAITASGGSWNASILAEVASWGSTHVEAHGIGAFIASATERGNFHQIVLGIAIMSLFVVLINRFFWRRLYAFAEQRYRLE
jgi:NitT/TauT family transport system permease protein